jgi:hypothetical protein
VHHLTCIVCKKKSEKQTDSNNLLQEALDVGYFATMNSECLPIYFCSDCMPKIVALVDPLATLMKDAKYPHFDSLVRTVRNYQLEQKEK